jgi:hypothetical protein
MEKSDFRHISELALIGGAAKLELASGVKNGRLKRLIKKLKKAVDKENFKVFVHETAVRHGVVETRIIIDDDDLEMIWQVFQKFSRDTGWETRTVHMLTRIQFCKALISNSERHFGSGIMKALDAIEGYYDRAGKLKMPNMWAADLACQRWLSLFGAKEDDGLPADERLKRIDAEIARESAFSEYSAKIYHTAQAAQNQ